MSLFKCWDLLNGPPLTDDGRGVDAPRAARAAEMAAEYWWWIGGCDVTDRTILVVEVATGKQTAWAVAGRQTMEFEATSTTWSPPRGIAP